MEQEHVAKDAPGSQRPWGLPRALASTVQRHFRYEVAVETGTYQGASTRVLREFVGRVYTIESNFALYEKSRQALANDLGIHIVFGSSPVVLPSILGSLDSCGLFWLDAHWFPEVAEAIGSQCPLLEELTILAQWPFIGDSCVLIDDARMFNTPLENCYRPSDWPTFPEIVKTARFTPSTVMAVIDDVIVVGPSTLTEAFSTYMAGPGAQSPVWN
jgi:hypothetical protein